MSHTRNKTTSSILNKLTQSNRTHQKQSRISLDLSLKAITLFLLAQAGTVKAALENPPPMQKDILHTLTNTWYRLKYPLDINFMSLPDNLSAVCHSVITSPTNFNFTDAATPQCTWMGQPSGVEVNIAVEEGKQLSTLFVDCFNQVMRPLCDAYNERYHHSIPTPPDNGDIDLYFAFFIPLMFALICSALLCLCCCLNKKTPETTSLNTSHNDHHHDHHHHGDTSVGAAGAGIASMLCCLLGMSMASANNSTTSNTSANTNYHSTNSGVSWNFARNPV